jgi:UDP-2-acetamido-2-deoxy-ribo-hexuluronate aminotransferase
MVYYPVPIHQQDFALSYAPAEGHLKVTEAASQHVLALPMHPYLGEADQDRIIETVLGFNG